MHAEHAEHSQLQQHVFTSLLCRPFVEKGLKSPLAAQQIIQICHSSWQKFVAVIQVHLGEKDSYRPNIAVSHNNSSLILYQRQLGSCKDKAERDCLQLRSIPC